MLRKLLPFFLLLIIAGALLNIVNVSALAGYSLDWWTVDGGGGGGGGTNSTGGSYSLGGSIGQPDAGISSGGTYSLSGGFWGGVRNFVSISGNAMAGGVTLSYTDGTPKTASADSSGNYLFTVAYNWSGTVTPSKTGLTFSPASRTYTNIQVDQTNQNFTIALVTISGNAGVGSAALSYTVGTLGTVKVADGSGNYSFTVPYNWSGKVTPSKPSYIFSPASRTYVNVIESMAGQDYVKGGNYNDIALSPTSVYESRPVGTLVGTFSTITTDTNTPFAYALVSGTGSSDNASFSISGDHLLTAVVFDSTVRKSYSIRVRSTDHAGTWLYGKPFTITILPKGTPIPASPEDAGALLNNRPTFDWLDVPGVIGYTIKIGKDAGFTRLLGTYTVSASSYTPKSDLPANATLYWSVRINEKGVPNPWSATRSLHTANPPSMPVLVAPANKALVSGVTPLLVWKKSILPTSTTFAFYQVQVATDSAFLSVVMDDSSVNSITFTQINTLTLAGNTSYYWRVRAVNTVGSSENFSDWSAVRTFRTK